VAYILGQPVVYYTEFVYFIAYAVLQSVCCRHPRD